MEEFISKKSEELLVFKRNVFKQAHAKDFIRKLFYRSSLKEVENELNKCLLNKYMTEPNEISKRKQFISSFLTEYEHIKNTPTQKPTQQPIQQPTEPVQKKTQNVLLKDENFQFEKKFKYDNENFPSLDNHELVLRKKKYVVLDKHYENKLEKGIKKCCCMSRLHPLVGNCLNCGRIHCLQEGDNVCIECGHKLISTDEYKKSIMTNNIAKNAYRHKEKLLQFQNDFYSKLQIIDDYSDWYEISNNTWISSKDRDNAKKKDEQNEITEIKV